MAHKISESSTRPDETINGTFWTLLIPILLSTIAFHTCLNTNTQRRQHSFITSPPAMLTLDKHITIETSF